MNARSCLPEKARIAKSFGRAAGSYDRYARLQRDIADMLLAPAFETRANRILDLGSGTGYCAGLLKEQLPQSIMTSMDISWDMLNHARQLSRGGGEQWVCGDGETLPFIHDSFDLVISSLTLQWCPNPGKFFREISRVLVPGGKALVSTLATNTLIELRQCWASIDSNIHVNSFLGYEDIIGAIGSTEFSRTHTSNSPEYYYYDSLQELTAELKGIGAHNLNEGQPAGLTGKSTLKKLKQSFEQKRITGKGIPVTYDLVLIALEK